MMPGVIFCLVSAMKAIDLQGWRINISEITSSFSEETIKFTRREMAKVLGKRN